MNYDFKKSLKNTVKLIVEIVGILRCFICWEYSKRTKNREIDTPLEMERASLKPLECTQMETVSLFALKFWKNNWKW